MRQLAPSSTSSPPPPPSCCNNTDAPTTHHKTDTAALLFTTFICLVCVRTHLLTIWAGQQEKAAKDAKAAASGSAGGGDGQGVVWRCLLCRGVLGIGIDSVVVVGKLRIKLNDYFVLRCVHLPLTRESGMTYEVDVYLRLPLTLPVFVGEWPLSQQRQQHRGHQKSSSRRARTSQLCRGSSGTLGLENFTQEIEIERERGRVLSDKRLPQTNTIDDT